MPNLYDKAEEVYELAHEHYKFYEALNQKIKRTERIAQFLDELLVEMLKEAEDEDDSDSRDI